MCLHRSLFGFVALLLLATYPSRSDAQWPEGTLGWCTVQGPGQTACFSTPMAACKAQHAYYAPNVPFYGYIDRENWYTKLCQWPTGLGIVNPTLIFFDCIADVNWRRAPEERCVHVNDDFQNRSPNSSVPNACSAQNINNGGNVLALTANPIDLLSGSKAFRADDFRGHDDSLHLTRVYSHLPFGKSSLMRTAPWGLGRNWRFEFQHEIHIPNNFSVSPQVELAISEGTAVRFIKDAAGNLNPEMQTWFLPQTDYTLEFVGAWPANSTVLTTQTQWRMRDPQRRTWLFQSFFDPAVNQYSVARPIQVTFEDGLQWTLQYGTNRQLLSVTDTFGKSLSFSWIMRDPSTVGSSLPPVPAAISNVGLPDGTSLRYVYETFDISLTPLPQPDRLLRVEQVNSSNVVVSSTTYHYEDARHRGGVTGISDTNGVRRWTVTYDGRGKALTSEGPGGADKVTVSYGALASSILPRTVTNALNKATTYKFRQFGTNDYRLTSIEGAASPNCPAGTQTYAYGTNKFISSITDEEGRVTAFVREARGFPTSVTRGHGTASAVTTIYAWHATLRAPTQIVQPGLTTDLVWNASGQLTQLTQTDTTSHSVPYATNGQTRVWAYTYTPGGRLASIDGPLSGTGDTVTYAYNAQGYLQSVTNEAGHLTQFTGWSGRGQPTTMTDPNGVVTNLAYDALGRLTSMTVDPAGINATTSFEYDTVDQITKVTRPNGAFLQYTYDNARRLTRVQDNTGAAIEYDRNALGNATARRIKDPAASVRLAQTATFDELGRLLTFVGAGTQTWTHAYDRTDNRVQVTDPRSNLYRWAFDPLNRLIRETDEDNAQVNLTLNGKDEVTTYSDPRSLATTYVRNGFGDAIQRMSPDSGTTVYQRNALGLATSITDGRGVVTNLAYDNAGRLLTKQFPGAPGENIAYTWDSTAGGNRGIGRPTGIDDASGSVEWVYDALGRRIQETKTTGAAGYTISYAYDAAGNITQVTYPSGRLVVFARDALGRVSGVTTKKDAASPTVTLASNVAYQPFGPLQGLSFGNGLTLAKTVTQDYDLSTLKVQDPTTLATIVDRSFARTDLVNLTGITEAAVSGRNETYTYTPTNRLQNAVGPWGTLTWSYDLVGNRTSEVLTAGSTSTFNYPAGSNRLASVTQGATSLRSFTHDGAGNVTADDRGGTVYDYRHNHRGRIDRVTVSGQVKADYSYDALERLALRATQNMTPSGTTHFVYDLEGRLLAESTELGVTLREYVWLDDLPLAVVADIDTATPKLYFVHADHLDRPIRMTDETKALVWDAVYRPFGEAHAITGPAANNLRFPGQYFLIEAGLHYNWHRHYDPSLGRYLQPDPLEFIDGPSLYAYAKSAPTMKVDPEGLQAAPSFPRPGFTPIPPVFVPGTPENRRWTDQAIRGVKGFVNACFRQIGNTTPNKNDPECDREWDEARAICADLLGRRNPPLGITGGFRNVEDCARGLVSERCGGNRVSR